MNSKALSRLFSFPVMLMTGLLVSPFIASLDVQQGGPVMRDPDIWWHLRNAEILLSTLAIRLAADSEAAASHLDRRIDAVMAFERWKARFKPTDAAAKAARALGRLRYGGVD